MIYRPTDRDGADLLAAGEEADFLTARGGDHLFCPFECDFCTFRKLKGRLPVPGDHSDELLQCYIRRANLDAFWSRRPGTVRGLARLFDEQVAVGEVFGFHMFKPLGPFRRDHDSGMRAALGVLYRAQKAGRHEVKLKFSSARKARTVHTNLHNASASGIQDALVWRSEKHRYVATAAPTDSAWFVSFMAGFRARVGERTKQDAAISIDVMLLTQTFLEEEWAEALDVGDATTQRAVAEHATFFLFLYCASLRGFEGPKVLLSELRAQIVAPQTAAAARVAPHVGIPLSGRFKAQTQDQQQILVPIAYRTSSGLQPGLWAERLLNCLARLGINTGWLFQRPGGGQKRMNEFEEKFYELLLRARQERPDLFPGEVNVLEDFHLGRSHRRGATSRATAAGVAAADIEWMNRWNIGVQHSGSIPMRVLYADRTQNMNTYLRFSLAL